MSCTTFRSFINFKNENFCKFYCSKTYNHVEKKFTLIVVTLVISNISLATIRSVGYTGIALPVVDYAIADFSLAKNSSSAGNTIQI